MPDSKNRAEQRKVQAQGRREEIRRQAAAHVDLATWNREPLKHYIRRNAWLPDIRDHVTKLQGAGITRPWKYLTFPGPDALDIALLFDEGLLERRTDGVLSVAICDRDNAESVAMRIMKYGGLLAYSGLMLDAALNEPENPLVREFPFDVINLDFCNSLIRQNRQNMDALDNIFRLQRGQGFLLLLTSRPDHDQRDEHIEIIRRNLQNEERFRAAYIQRYQSDDPESCVADYTNFTQIVFSKIVARYARDFGYKTTELHVAKYRKPGGFDMVCHCFDLDPLNRSEANKFEPRLKKVPPRDRIEEVLGDELSARVRQMASGEYESSIADLPTRNVLNVNSLLENNQTLAHQLEEDVIRLEEWIR